MVTRNPGPRQRARRPGMRGTAGWGAGHAGGAAMSRRTETGRAARLALALAVLLVGGLAGPASAYLYQVTTAVDRSVSNFRVTDIYLPASVTLAWDYSGLGSGTPQFELQRGTGTSP